MKANNNMQDREIRHRSTFSILFYINRTKMRKDGTCQLLCKVSIDAVAAQIGIKVAVNSAHWNPETGRADGRSENALTVNRAIDDLTKQIKGHYNRIKNSLGFVTAELVKNAVKGIGQKPLTLLELFKEHNEEVKARIGTDCVEETYKIYVRSHNHLLSFIQKKSGKDDVALRGLDKKFYEEFENYLYTDCCMKDKTVYEELYRLKKMSKRAVSQGTLRVDPYARMRPKYPERKSRHLKLEDLKKLMETQIDKPNLQRVRDWFIFSTFTGLAYADLKRLSQKDITRAEDGSLWIHIQRKKTDTPSAIRLLDVPLRIIEKYKEERVNDKIFNLYSRSYLIRLTKKLGEIYGFYMTFHKARHNFGTHITLSMGVPIETVSRMMGHKSISTTQIYAKVTDKKVDEDMKELKKRTKGNTVSIYEDSMEIKSDKIATAKKSGMI